MTDDALPRSQIILYQTEDGRTRIQCRFENETLWLTQALIAELFPVTVPTVNEHLKSIFDEGELAAEATIRKFRIVQIEGARVVAGFSYPGIPDNCRDSRNVTGNAASWRMPRPTRSLPRKSKN